MLEAAHTCRLPVQAPERTCIPLQDQQGTRQLYEDNISEEGMAYMATVEVEQRKLVAEADRKSLAQARMDPAGACIR